VEPVSLIALLVFAGIMLVVLLRANRYRRCPFCKQKIRATETTCPMCEKDLTALRRPQH